MATDDQQRLVVGTASTPATFTVPGNGQIKPKAVFAHFDGSGAAGSFTPTFKVTSDAGKLVGIYPLSTSLAAGGSAEASWFPGVGSEGTGTTSSGVQLARANIVGNQSIAAGDPGQIIVWGEAPIDTGSPSAFWAAGNPSRLTCPVNGVYLFLANIEWDVMHDDTDLGCYLYKNGSSILLETFLSKFDANPVLSSSGPGSDSFTEIHSHHNVFQANAGDYFELLAYVQPSAGIPAAVDLIDKRPALQLYSSFTSILLAAT